MRRDEAFRKADHARAIAARLADQPAGLRGRSFAVEEHGRGLHGRHLYHRIDVTHEAVLRVTRLPLSKYPASREPFARAGARLGGLNFAVARRARGVQG